MAEIAETSKACALREEQIRASESLIGEMEDEAERNDVLGQEAEVK